MEPRVRIATQGASKSRAGRLLTEERGLVLPVALMAMMILGVLAAALLSVGAFEVQVSANHLQATQAQFLAEAGLEDAIGVFVADPRKVSQAPTGQLQTLAVSPPDATLAHSGTYAVQYQRVGSDTVRVVSTGRTTGGSSRVVRAVISTTFRSNDAIRSNGDLTIPGNPTITGLCGSAHTNQDFTISGDPTISGSATASGEYVETGHPVVGSWAEHVAKKYVPPIDPADFLLKAKQLLQPNQVFQMKANGWILDGNDQLIAIVLPEQDYRGWRFSLGTPPVWVYNSPLSYNGTYYIEGDAKIGGSPGTLGNPWDVTVIATHDVEISGTPKIASHLRDTFVVAGQDVKITGNPDQVFEGLIAAHEQVGISGNPEINGYIMAEDAEHLSGTVVQTGINGNVKITYDCTLNPPLAGLPEILAVGP